MKLNKAKQELLDKCIKTKYNEKLPNFNGIYIIQTNLKHESGYKIMYIIGHTSFKKEGEIKYYLIDKMCDVVEIDNLLNQCNIKELKFDITTSGIIHMWCNYNLLKVIFRCSNCTFELLEEEIK